MKTMRALSMLSALAMFGAVVAMAPAAQARGNVPTDQPVIFVTSQGLYFDSIVQTMLPQEGPFQQLFPTGGGLETEFGPGDVGYLGGRWWLDFNNNGEMDGGDMYFSCPLLGPGREVE